MQIDEDNSIEAYEKLADLIAGKKDDGEKLEDLLKSSNINVNLTSAKYLENIDYIIVL